jgi:hypothetical protein
MIQPNICIAAENSFSSDTGCGCAESCGVIKQINATGDFGKKQEATRRLLLTGWPIDRRTNEKGQIARSGLLE